MCVCTLVCIYTNLSCMIRRTRTCCASCVCACVFHCIFTSLPWHIQVEVSLALRSQVQLPAQNLKQSKQSVRFAGEQC